MDDVAPNLGDYLWVLRRQARTIVIACALGAALAVALWALDPQGGGWSSMTKVNLVDEGPSLGIALGGESAPAGVALAPLVEQVNSPAFKTAVLKRTGGATSSRILIRATGDESSRLVTIRVEGPSRKVTSSVLDGAKEELRDLRRGDLLDRYATAVVALTTRRDLAQARLVSIEALLAQEPPGSARSVSLTHERVFVQERVDDAAAGLAAFERYQADGDGGVKVVSGSVDPSATGGLSLPRAVPIGVLLGALVGVGVILLRRFVELPVDSRASLERCGTRCVAVLGRKGGDRLAQAAVGQMIGKGALAVLLAPGVPSSELPRLIPDPESSSIKVLDDVSDVANGAPLLLVVRAGTPEDDVRSLILTSQSLGADVVGAVLTGLPDAGLAQAFSR